MLQKEKYKDDGALDIENGAETNRLQNKQLPKFEDRIHVRSAPHREYRGKISCPPTHNSRFWIASRVPNGSGYNITALAVFLAR